jgi:RNA polymerase sigma-70 factor (ECF subfamily)
MAENSSGHSTSASLLARLRHAPTDQEAWSEFVGRYGLRIRGWCGQWGLQEADAQDVTQDVLLRLTVKMRSFNYDAQQSFRAWLKTLAHHAWSDFVSSRRRKAAQGSGGTAVLEILQNVEARADLEKQLDETFDRELLEEAMTRVQRRVRPRTWEAFRLTALEGQSGAEAAARLGMQEATVFVARSKVQKMLHEETRRLEGPESEREASAP